MPAASELVAMSRRGERHDAVINVMCPHPLCAQAAARLGDPTPHGDNKEIRAIRLTPSDREWQAR